MIGSAKEIEPLARSVDSTAGVTFVPAFSGLFAPYWRSDARACIVGMTLYTKKAHLCRATLEAVALQAREVLDAMEGDSGVKLSELEVDGGMTINELLMQMQADFIQVRITAAQQPHSSRSSHSPPFLLPPTGTRRTSS